EQLGDLELMDRIGGHVRSVSSAPRRQRRYLWSRRSAVESEAPPDATPAERITLSTPAVKPRSANTNIPHGKEPSQRSISQPSPAPTRMPATSSEESWKPRAKPEALVACRGAGPVSAARSAPIWSNR